MCFFFLQAEDGIRDHCVTGVQTCALPISSRREGRALLIRRAMRALPSGWRLAAVALAAASALLSGRANADEGLRLKIDWGGLASLMRDGGAALLPLESPRVESRPESATTSADARWVGASPHLSVVARDWGGAQLLVGHLSLTDHSRVTRTSRMVITRLR